MAGKETLLLLVILNMSLDSNACHNNWVSHDSNCYFFSHGRLSWVDAFGMCKILGGILLEVDSNTEKEFVDRKVAELHRGDFWIGAHDSEEDNVFVWATSRSPVSIRHFAAGEPNNVYENENCLQINVIGFWNDNDCSKAYQYICEAEPAAPSIG